MKTRKDWEQVYLEETEYLSNSEEPIRKLSDFYNSEEIRQLGIKCGNNCLLHKNTIIVNPENLTLGDKVRIDGYCTISAGSGISIGSYVHIAGYVTLMGGAGIDVLDYASIASGAKVYSVSDDIMGRALVGPCVPKEKRHLHSKKVVLGEHSVLAVNSVVMPGGGLGKGAVLLPFSLIKEHVSDMEVWSGCPGKFVKNRKLDFLNLLES